MMPAYNPFTGKYYELRKIKPKTGKGSKTKNLWNEPKTKRSLWDLVEVQNAK